MDKLQIFNEKAMDNLLFGKILLIFNDLLKLLYVSFILIIIINLNYFDK